VFDHVTIRASDRDASERFYDTVLEPFAIERRHSDEHYAQWLDFSLAQAGDADQVTRNLHVAFAARTREDVDRFWHAGVGNGYADDGEPGPRPQYSASYYGAFLRDPDGNSAEAVHHDSVRGATLLDHLWIRVGDVEASQRFYETIATCAGFRVRRVAPDKVRCAGEEGSFTLVAGEPTRNVHLAFPAGDDATVDAFHETALAAGYRDNGPPGERRIYHAGYYGAFVLDPDGSNVEVVNHNR
jgi:catechol 2,3-dioxygenase-like lactoylglutathione lyase family enzyme